MKFAIAIPQFYADGEFDPATFRAYLARAEELGFESAWTQEGTLNVGPQLSPIEAMTYAAACTERMRLGCVVFVVHPAQSGSSGQEPGLARPAQPRPARRRRGHRRPGAPVRRLRRGSGPVRGPVQRGRPADEGAVDRAPGHLRRRVLAARGRADGAQAVHQAISAAVVRRGQRARAAPGRAAGHRLLRRRLLPHRRVRGAGPDRAGGAGRGGPGRRTSPSPSACTSGSTTTPSAPGTG